MSRVDVFIWEKNVWNLFNELKLRRPIALCDRLGYKHFCSACKGSQKEDGELICRAKNGKFYGLPVKQVLMAPCMRPKEN